MIIFIKKKRKQKKRVSKKIWGFVKFEALPDNLRKNETLPLKLKMNIVDV